MTRSQFDNSRPLTTTQTVDDDLLTLQHQIQRLLGHCLLRVQQYERLIKAIVAYHKISVSGSFHDLKSTLDPTLGYETEVSRVANMTLGTLVGELLGSYISSGQSTEPPEAFPDKADFGFSMVTTLSMSAEDYQQTQSDLKKFVGLRNNLVHHFIDQHDLWTTDGCRKAQDALLTSYTLLGQYFEQLRGWAEHMQQTRKLAAEFVNSDTFRNLIVNSTAPDGTVHWASSGIVHALREAAHELTVDGWTPVASAGQWISQRTPDEQPSRYGCSSWRQVVHESQLFELRYREVNGRRAAWYRARPVQSPGPTT